MKPFQQQENPTGTLVEQRRSLRHPPAQEGTHIWLDETRRMSVAILDESDEGIGVLIRDTSFQFGPKIDVDYNGERRAARVAYLARLESGDFRLGVEWIR